MIKAAAQSCRDRGKQVGALVLDLKARANAATIKAEQSQKQRKQTEAATAKRAADAEKERKQAKESWEAVEATVNALAPDELARLREIAMRDALPVQAGLWSKPGKMPRGLMVAIANLATRGGAA